MKQIEIRKQGLEVLQEMLRPIQKEMVSYIYTKPDKGLEMLNSKRIELLKAINYVKKQL